MKNETIEEVMYAWKWRIAKANMTQKEFCKYVGGVTQTSLSQYINGKKRPRPITYSKIEESLKLLGV